MALKLPTLSPRVEVTLRITLTSLVLYILSLAYLPTAVPTSLRQLVGILGPTFALSLPHLIFILGGALPSVVVAMIIGLLGATALLAAATVSDGLYVAMFAVWALWSASLSYGPNASKTARFSGLQIAIAALLSLGSWQLVQNGLAITIDLPYDEDPTKNRFLSEVVSLLFQEICGHAYDPETCSDVLASLAPPGVEFTIPGDSNFSGQTAIVSCLDATCTMTVPGGLWLVRGYWVWQGLENPLAVMRNFLIVVCWALLVVSLGRLAPPFRTVRKVYTRGLLPSAISNAASFIATEDAEVENGIGSEDKAKSEEEEARENVEKLNSDQMQKEKMQQKLIHDAVQNANGGMAPMTAFEPRVCHSPFECTWPKLKELSIRVNSLALFALGNEIRTHFNERETEEDKKEFSKQIKVLNQCSAALVKDEDMDSASSAARAEQDETADEENSGEATFSYFVQHLSHITSELKTSTSAWLDTMHYPKYTGAKDTAMSYAPWIMGPVTSIKDMMLNLLIPFQPKKWNLRSCAVAVKFALGATILVICEVYWVQYRGFAVGESREAAADNPRGPVTVTVSFFASMTRINDQNLNFDYLTFLPFSLLFLHSWMKHLMCTAAGTCYHTFSRPRQPLRER